jgi:tetratricopeptide (TPR) repeat protein
MRQYAEEKLAEDPEEHILVRDLHADYFCGLMAQNGQRVLAGEHHLIAPVYENIREALVWSIAHKKVSNFSISVVGLLFYYGYRGTIDDGVNFILTLINELESFAQPGEESGLVYAQTLLVLAYLYRRGYESRFEETEYAIKEGLNYLQASRNFPREQAFLYVFIPWLNTSSPIEENRHYFEIALNTYQELNDEWGIALAHDYWAWTQSNSGDALSAEPHHVEALKIYQKLKDGRGTAACLAGIGYALWTRHEYDKALNLIKEGANIIESLDLYNDKLIYYYSIISLSMVMGDFNAAYELAKKGYMLVQKKGGRYGLVNMLAAMIKSSIELKKYEEAQTRMEELLKVYSQDHIDNPRISGLIYRTSGHLDLELNNPKKARLNYHKALENTRQAIAENQVQAEIYIVIKYEIVLWIARWLKGTERFLLAGEIAYFVSMYEHYPRSFYNIVGDYTRILQELENHLSPEELTAARGHAEKRDLESTLEELLDLLDQKGGEG